MKECQKKGSLITCCFCYVPTYLPICTNGEMQAWFEYKLDQIMGKKQVLLHRDKQAKWKEFYIIFDFKAWRKKKIVFGILINIGIFLQILALMKTA